MRTKIIIFTLCLIVGYLSGEVIQYIFKPTTLTENAKSEIVTVSTAFAPKTTFYPIPDEVKHLVKQKNEFDGNKITIEKYNALPADEKSFLVGLKYRTDESLSVDVWLSTYRQFRDKKFNDGETNEEYWGGDPYLIRYIETHIKPGMNVADIGCGHMSFAIQLARLVGKDGIAFMIDTDPNVGYFLDIRRKRWVKEGRGMLDQVKFVNNKFDNICIQPNTLDFACMQQVHGIGRKNEDYKTQIDFGKSIYKALKKDSTLIMIENEQPNKMFSANEISGMLQASGFRKPEIIAENVVIEINEPSSPSDNKKMEKRKKYFFIYKK